MTLFPQKLQQPAIPSYPKPAFASVMRAKPFFAQEQFLALLQFSSCFSFLLIALIPSLVWHLSFSIICFFCNGCYIQLFKCLYPPIYFFPLLIFKQLYPA